MRIDLHTHTTASDGKLTPAELAAHAVHCGIDTLAITDHDTVEAYGRLGRIPHPSLRLISGVEFSTQWRKTDIHILGLNIDTAAPSLTEGIAIQQRHRLDRAGRIAARLTGLLGLDHILDAVQQLSQAGNIGRPHFAQYLINSGVVKDQAEAFKKYLGTGKKAYIKPSWAEPADVICWIREAGGTALLAHPGRYNLSTAGLMSLVDDFAAAGGQGLEVVTGNQPSELTAWLARICSHKDLLASCGSDFHGPDQRWASPGKFPALPGNCIPVWDSW
jgi:predicted metal-dependent phosphoesterase TrpH